LGSTLPEGVTLRTLPNGALVAVVTDESLLRHSAATVALAADGLGGGGLLERRAEIAVGLVDGADPWAAAVVNLAVRFARAAQAGQTLCGYGTARLLPSWCGSIATDGSGRTTQRGPEPNGDLLLGPEGR
jgi:hypothetical protein